MTIKTPKNSPKPPKIPDLAYVRAVARKIIGRIESDLEITVDSEPHGTHHERLYGAKASLAGTLVSLGELIIKLEQASRPQAVKDVDVAPAEIAVAPSDVALIEAFVRRARDTTGMVMSPTLAE